MSSSESQILKAKQLYQSGNLSAAKDLLVQIISDPNKNLNRHKLLAKLGDISVDLSEYEAAAKYYQQSLEYSPLDTLICIKLANILQDYLNRYNEAQRIYAKCSIIDQNNEECWFNYGRLLVKQNKFNSAEQCFLKCTTEKACVNYHYGMLLSQKNDKKRALQLLFKATKIRPDVTKYHYRYALCLENVGLFSEADMSFQKALDLSKFQDAKILFDYAEFQRERMKDTELACCYLEQAISMDPHNKYQFIRDKYNTLIDSKKQSNEKCDAIIKLLIYNFDEIIIRQTTKYVGLPIEFMDDTIFQTVFFGKEDRVKNLRGHFKRILSSKNNIGIVMLSDNPTLLVRKFLQRVGLSERLTVVGCDHKLYKGDHILQRIIKISKAYELETSKNVLFVDGEINNIELTKDYCATFAVFGILSYVHIKEIEQLIGFQSVQFNKGLWKWDNNGRWENFDVFASKQIDEEIEKHLYHSTKRKFRFAMKKGPHFSQKKNVGIYICHVEFNKRRDKIIKIFQRNIKTQFIRKIARSIDDEKTEVLEMKMNSFEDNKELENDSKFAQHMTYDEAKRLQIGDKIDYRNEKGLCVKATIDEIEMKKTVQYILLYGIKVQKHVIHKHIKIRFVNGINEVKVIWLDIDKQCDHELIRLYKYKTISESISDRFTNVETNCLIDINPIVVDPGWKPGQIVTVQKGQVKVKFKNSITKKNHKVWLHLDNEVECAEVGKGHLNNEQIEALFYTTLRRDLYKIVEIKKIEENKDNTDMYESLLKIKCKNGKKQWEVEKYLWHGTPSVGAVIMNGFDRSYNEVGKFGKGTYFARNASYSVAGGYCSKDGYKLGQTYFVLLCRVIVGEYTLGREDMKKIPKKEDGTEYDSLVNNLKHPSIFVSWRDFMAIPYYLIKFKYCR